MYCASDIDLESDGYGGSNAAESTIASQDLQCSKVTRYLLQAATLVGASYGLDVFCSYMVSRSGNWMQDPGEYLTPEAQTRVAEAVDAEDVWAEVGKDLSSYSATDLVERVHEKVMGHLDFDWDYTCTGVDNALAEQEGICFDYAGMTYGTLLKLASDHPELADHLEDVRWAFGVRGEEATQHSWLQVRGDDGAWHDYETAVDVVTPNWDHAEVLRTNPPLDRGGYSLIGALQMDVDGAIERDVEWGNVLLPKAGAGEGMVNRYEQLSGHDIPNDIEAYIPETLAITAAGLGIARGVKLSLKAAGSLVRGRDRDKEKE